MTSLTASDISALFRQLRETMEENRDRLTKLDAALGDGDLGITMAKGFTEAASAVEDEDATDIGRLLMRAGMTIAGHAPSTMGTLIASGFMKAGKELKGSESVDLGGILTLFSAFTNGIRERGKAEPGDKTIIDALVPAVGVLQNAAGNNASLREALDTAYKAAVEVAESTRSMTARHGRPSYYGDRSVGKEDPGSVVGVLILKVFAEYTSG